MAVISPVEFEIKAGDRVLLRSAVADDAVAMIEHLRHVSRESSYLITEPDEVSLTEEQEREWIDAHTILPTSLPLVAEVDGKLVGVLNFACGERRRLSHRGSLGLTVRASYQAKGIGSAMLEVLIEWAEAHPTVEKITLAVVATNTPAIKLYKKHGFLEEGRRLREVKLGPDEYVDDVLMYRFVDGNR